MFQLRKDPMRETYFAKIFYLYLKSYSVGKINQALGRSLGYLFERLKQLTIY